MTELEARAALARVRAHRTEEGWFEFKENNAEPDAVGRYVSSLANSAALAREPFGYLIWGVKDGSHELVGTEFDYHSKAKGNEDFIAWLTRQTTPRVDVRPREIVAEGKRVVVLRVPAANTQPVAFEGTEYVRVGSYQKKLRDYPEKARELWRLVSGPDADWSAQVCPGATLADLDPAAIAVARAGFKEKHPRLAAEVDSWDAMTFLNKARLASDGKITRTAIVLLGREDSTHHISPAVAHITWLLLGREGEAQDYAHFEPPFLLRVNEVYAKIRNLTLREMVGGSIFPREISRYDDWVFREALHNCIAHQDYDQCGRINVVERDDSLLFTNLGSFIPGSVESVLQKNGPEERYRNPCLAQSMVNLNMIDTVGSGIRKMFSAQKARFLPMPDYD